MKIKIYWQWKAKSKIKKSPLDIAMQFANVYRRSLEQAGTSQLLPLEGVINISYDGVNRFLQRKLSHRGIYTMKSKMP